MVHLRFAATTSAAFICAFTLVVSTSARSPLGTVATVQVPDHLASALADATALSAAGSDRASTLYELIRRSYESTPPWGAATTTGPVPAPVALSGRIAAEAGRAVGTSGKSGAGLDAVPLPLPPDVWIGAVFGGRTTPETLVSDILASRDAALLYYGLFWLDDETREWLARAPDLVNVIAAKHAARFTLVAPAFRVSSGSVRLPGGDAARAGWEALVGASAAAPSEFLQALLARDNGRLAYFFGAMGQLSDARLRFGLDLAADRDRRVAATARVYRTFERLARYWSVDAAPFWRPTLDPGLLLSELAPDESGATRVPGTLAFWKRVFERDEPSRDGEADPGAGALAEGDPIDFPTLCELLSERDEIFYQRAHRQVLFASRIVKHVTTDTARDAVDAVRAAGAQPALVGTLERAHVRSVSLFARASRRAAELSRLGASSRAARALRQFQGALFVVARAALRGSLAASQFEQAVESLVDVPLSADGHYEGRVVSWLAGLPDSGPGGAPSSSPAGVASGCVDPFGEGTPASTPLDTRVLRLLAGASPECPAIEWEGTRYRVDLAWAEGTRVQRLLGTNRRPYLAAAQQAVAIADALGTAPLSADQWRTQGAALETLIATASWEPGIRDALKDAASALKGRAARRTAEALGLAADDLLACGLTNAVYAASLGQPDRVLIDAADAAARHDFGFGRTGSLLGTSEWRLPVPDADGQRDWHLTGSLLGLDVSLAEFALVGVSMRPPSRVPTMNERERRTFVEGVALTEPAALDQAQAGVIVAAVQRGRARVAAITTQDEAMALADEAGFSAARRTLLSWTAGHEPGQVTASFSPVDLFWLGLAGAPAGALDAWGASAEPRSGCLCLTLEAPRPWEVLTGRWAMMASAFPDLKLKLASLLAERHLPAVLLASVLAPATLEFVNTANPGGRHDRRTLERYVNRLDVDQLEQYLALMTTGGPLVPMDGGASHTGAEVNGELHREGEVPAAAGDHSSGARR